MQLQKIETKIYEIRGLKVMLDLDLAELYEVETRVLNQAVKRNLIRFPVDFMFQLESFEYEKIKIQTNVMAENSSSQTVMIGNLPQNRTNKYLPYAFTEQGVAMLSGILRSTKAIKMNIAIMRTFVEVRRIVAKQTDLKEQLKELKEKLGEHDEQLNQIYLAMENLIDERSEQQKWDNRKKIGFL